MSDLDKLLSDIYDIKNDAPIYGHERSMCKNAIAEVRVMSGLLTFALANRAKFTEHDPDGVRARWIEQVEKWNKMP